MAWAIEKTRRGWEWSCANSGYGAACGVEPTKAQAKVELYIAERDMFEQPLPRAVCEVMRSDPQRFAAGLGAADGLG